MQRYLFQELPPEFTELETAPEEPVIAVGELALQIKDLFQTVFPRKIWVRGETSKIYPSKRGHVYFDLKDAKGTLKCVVFDSGSTPKIRSFLTDGAALEVHGLLSVYPPNGEYRLVVDDIRALGQGSLFEAYLKLKERLTAEGLFDSAHKQPLPPMPTRVGVVTSPTGAVIQDIFRNIKIRWPLTEVLLSPCTVQGKDAPQDIIKALRRLEALKPDVIIIGRGGGSFEDLFCFNDEALVRAIYACPIPIISAVGHETDTTLCDHVSDLRAATPTEAAVRAVPDQEKIRSFLIGLENGMLKNLRMNFNAAENVLTQTQVRLKAQAPSEKIRRERQNTRQLEERLERDLRSLVETADLLMDSIDARLEAVNPANIMQRGYAIVRRGSEVISSAASLRPDASVTLCFADGEAEAKIQNTKINNY